MNGASERFHETSDPELHRPSTDAARLHASLTALLREKGHPISDYPDAQYYNLPIPGRRDEVVTISNYFTQLLHKAYQTPDKATATDRGQLDSLDNGDAIIDIDFPGAGFACFRPGDIRPTGAYLFGLTPAELKDLPQNQFVLFGPQGLVDVANDEIAQFLTLVAWFTEEHLPTDLD